VMKQHAHRRAVGLRYDRAERPYELCHAAVPLSIRTDGGRCTARQPWRLSRSEGGQCGLRTLGPLDMETTPGIAILTRSVAISRTSRIFDERFVRKAGRLAASGARSPSFCAEGEPSRHRGCTTRSGQFPDANLELLKTLRRPGRHRRRECPLSRSWKRVTSTSPIAGAADGDGRDPPRDFPLADGLQPISTRSSEARAGCVAASTRSSPASTGSAFISPRSTIPGPAPPTKRQLLPQVPRRERPHGTRVPRCVVYPRVGRRGRGGGIDGA